MIIFIRICAWTGGGVGVGTTACGAPITRSGEQIDWEQVGEETTLLLSHYLRVNTSNSPGNEKIATEFLRGVFDRAGLPVTVWEPAPGKANIITRLASNGRKLPILLLHSTDVVPAARSFWTGDPFAGGVRDGYIWGRGALYKKGLGIAQIVAALTPERQGLVLDREVILLATSDEEIVGVAKNHRDAHRNAEFVLNEGGNIATDSVGRTPFCNALAAENAPLGLEVLARGTPGHGSIPQEDTASNRLERALEKIPRWPPPLTVERYFRAIVPTLDSELRPFSADIRRGIADPAARERLEKNPRHYALLRNTISITGLDGFSKTYVIPPVGRAELDVRLLPGQNPQAFLAEIRHWAGNTVSKSSRAASVGRRPSRRSIPTSIGRSSRSRIGRNPASLSGPCSIPGSRTATTS